MNKQLNNKTNRELIADRRKEVIALRREGCSFREIGDILGVSSTTAFKDAKAIIAEVVRETKDMYEEIRAIELMKLDELEVANLPKAMDGDTKASGIILSIQKRRAELLGLDAPAKSKIDLDGGLNIVLPKGDPEKG